ncbi:MAG: RAMP superfamily CRISPR-associated protein [Thermoplasmatales archaeon]|nr:RAMP superfamily CRISPR-associated protein [Thermoplasmatales archaeon]
MELTIEVASDFLFVGSGNYDLRDMDKLVYYSFFRTNQNITIPGTSIKGAVRSVAEAISNSCVIVKGNQEKLGINPCKFDLEKGKIQLCPACRIFGITDYSGRVCISDAVPLKIETEIIKIGELWGPRINRKKRKFYQNKLFNPVGNLRPEKNHRFVEAVRKGSRFSTSLRYQNLTEGELSLILYAMGVNQDYMIKIGGAKPRCLGTVRFIAGKLLVLSEDLLSFTEKSIAEIIRNSELIEPELLTQFKNEISKEKEYCPKGMY